MSSHTVPIQTHMHCQVHHEYRAANSYICKPTTRMYIHTVLAIYMFPQQLPHTHTCMHAQVHVFHPAGGWVDIGICPRVNTSLIGRPSLQTLQTKSWMKTSTDETFHHHQPSDSTGQEMLLRIDMYNCTNRL